jgi:hypothetical protein
MHFTTSWSLVTFAITSLSAVAAGTAAPLAPISNGVQYINGPTQNIPVHTKIPVIENSMKKREEDQTQPDRDEFAQRIEAGTYHDEAYTTANALIKLAPLSEERAILLELLENPSANQDTWIQARLSEIKEVAAEVAKETRDSVKNGVEAKASGSGDEKRLLKNFNKFLSSRFGVDEGEIDEMPRMGDGE